MLTALLLVGLMVVAAPGSGPASAPQAQADPLDAAAMPGAQEDMPRFDARVQSIHVTSMVHFDERGKPRHQVGNLSISLVISHGPDIAPTSYHDLRIDRILTSSGEELKVTGRQNRPQMINHGVMNRAGRQNQFQLSVAAALPQWAPARLSEIRGSMRVECAYGPPIAATLGTFKQIEGQAIRIEGLPEVELTVGRRVNNQVWIEGNALAGKLLRSVTFLDAEGGDLESQGWGQSGTDLPNWRFNVKMPDEGTIRVEVFPRSRTVDVPLLIQDVEMPQWPGGDGRPV